MPSRSLILERERVNADDKYSIHTQDPLSLTSTNTKQSVLCCLTNTSTRSLSTRERIVCRGLLSAAITATLPFARLCLRYQSRDSLSLSRRACESLAAHSPKCRVVAQHVFCWLNRQLLVRCSSVSEPTDTLSVVHTVCCCRHRRRRSPLVRR